LGPSAGASSPADLAAILAAALQSVTGTGVEIL
jgi:hypothetical protein